MVDTSVITTEEIIKRADELTDKTSTLLYFGDFVTVAGYIIAILIAVVILEEIICLVPLFVRSFTHKRKAISDIESNELLKQTKFSKFGINFITRRL